MRPWVIALLFGMAFSYGELSWPLVTLLITVLFGVMMLWLFFKQDTLLYQPLLYPQYRAPSMNPAYYKSPEEYRMPFDEVYIDVPDGVRLHAWFIRQPDAESRPTLLFFHANAGNMGFRLPNMFQLYVYLKVNIFIVSYRGYGESTGTPEEQGMLLDAQTAWQYMQTRLRIDHTKIVVFGRSLGGAVAIGLASKVHRHMKALIVENTYTCISDMVDRLLPFLKRCKSFMLKLDWPSVQRISDVTCPVLFLSGQKDEVVPPDQMRQLYLAAKRASVRTIVRFPQGMHNDTWTKTGYIGELRHFMNTVMPGSIPEVTPEEVKKDYPRLFAVLEIVAQGGMATPGPQLPPGASSASST